MNGHAGGGDGIAERIEAWDGLAVVARHDAEAEAWMFVALHDPALGLPVGGTRMRRYARPADGLRDAMRLAEGMTFKWAALDLPFGGGKAVLALSRPLGAPEREAFLRRYGRLLRTLNGAFRTGVDLGTTPGDMEVLAEECPHIMGIVHGASRDPGPYTALGVFVGMRSALRHAFGDDDPAGRSVLVQGLGDVGLPLARMLAEAGADLLLADLDADAAAEAASATGGRVVAPDAVPDTSCDVYAPCAVGGILNPDTIPRLRCRVVAGSANNQLESEADADLLHERGILYAPDYVVNGGGALAFALMNRGEWDDDALRDAVRGVGDSLDGIFAEAGEADESPARVARRRAERVLERERGGPRETRERGGPRETREREPA